MDMHIWMGNEQEHVCDTLLLWLWFGGEGNGMKYNFILIKMTNNHWNSNNWFPFVGGPEMEIFFSIVDDDDCEPD